MSTPVAVVTGASSGIGAATVRRLAARGYGVVAVARRAERLEQLAAEHSGAVLAHPADVTDAAQARGCIDRAVAEFGQLDLLVNNAGIMLLGPFATRPDTEWRQMIELNLIALLHLSQEAIPHLREAAAGPRGVADIINVGSLAGRVARTNFAVYSATKFGVTAFTESLRQELAPDGVRVSCVQPGATESELLDHVDPEVHRTMMGGSMSAVRRITSDDVALTIEQLAVLDPAVAVNELVVRATRTPF